jgi:hypothetical protein
VELYLHYPNTSLWHGPYLNSGCLHNMVLSCAQEQLYTCVGYKAWSGGMIVNDEVESMWKCS